MPLLRDHGDRSARTAPASAWLAALLAAAIALLAGCSGGTAAEPAGLTDTQAEQLSLARFTTYQLGTVTLDAAFTMGGIAVTLAGWVDYPSGVAYAESTENGAPRNLLMWDRSTVAIRQIDGAHTAPPLPQPELDDTWGTGPIDTTTSELQQILVVILEFGSDRPDNMLLVRQGGARFLRTDRIGAAPMNVYAVPPAPTGPATDAATAPAGRQTGAPSPDQRSIDYWIDTDGAIRRATFTLAGGAAVTISLGRGAGPALRDPFGTPVRTSGSR